MVACVYSCNPLPRTVVARIGIGIIVLVLSVRVRAAGVPASSSCSWFVREFPRTPGQQRIIATICALVSKYSRLA
uniref:Uncharacterized protein n=1 Tax=Arundo donax TaxID=35708 RepID=A0A0A9D751_ARUDO